jgi:hypothetical protein
MMSRISTAPRENRRTRELANARLDAAKAAAVPMGADEVGDIMDAAAEAAVVIAAIAAVAAEDTKGGTMRGSEWVRGDLARPLPPGRF